MILPSMTCKEMYDNLAKDLKKVQIKEGYLQPKAVREFKKEKRFPAWRWYEYTIPATNNKYIIFFYAESRFVVEKPKVNYFSIVFDRGKRYVLKWVAGAYKHTDDNSTKLIRQVHAYTSHFLERYNERFFKDESLTINDVACRYFSRNGEITPIKMNKNINKHLEKYGDDVQWGYRVRDGFCFAKHLIEGKSDENGNSSKDEVAAILVMFATFMNESDLKDTQLTAINKEYDATWLRYTKTIQEESIDWSTTLELEP